MIVNPRQGFSSAPVLSRQTGPHKRLAERLRRHAGRPYLQPLHRPTVQLFESLMQVLEDHAGQPLILDSGCGNGLAATVLAGRNPGALVLGIDKSAHRLRGRSLVGGLSIDGNCVWMRAELATFWRLLESHRIRLAKHYLLYPNPWPKPGQLLRRWHAHPVFPTMLRLGGTLEMRTNWQVYASEFALAIAQLSGQPVSVEPLPAGQPLSQFERKYLHSGHALYRVRLSDLSSRGNQACNNQNNH